MWVKENQTGGNVCPVRIVNRDQPLLAELVSFRCGVDELCQFRRPGLKILDVKNSFSKTSKEAGHPVFQYLAADSQKRSPGPQFSSERKQVSLIAACTMQHEQYGQCGFLRRKEGMGESQIIRRLHRLVLHQSSAVRFSATPFPVPDGLSQAKAAVSKTCQAVPRFHPSKSREDQSRSQTKHRRVRGNKWNENTGGR